jgi:hypothetical protein
VDRDSYQGGEGGGGRRSFFRVRTRLPVRFRPVGPEEVERLEAEIRTRKAPSAPPVDPHLAEWLDRIEAKLDRLLSQAGLAEKAQLGPEEEQEILLSGSGMKFQSPSPYSPGMVLLVEFELPTTPRHRVRTLARVIEQDPGPEEGEEFPVVVAFHTIHEIDRDAVVGHTLAVERAELRSGLYRPRDDA